MKNFILMLICAIGLAFASTSESKAQLIDLSVSAAEDTLTDAGTSNLTTTIQGQRSVITFQLSVSRVSGTAAGTAKLQGSINGTNFFDIGSAYTITNVASQHNVWIVTQSPYTFYRINIVGAGTQVIAPTGKALIRK
jgi:hypothetical protein